MENRRSATRRGEADWISCGALEGACVFLSDLHLMTPTDGSTQLLLNFCKELKESPSNHHLSRVRHFFLLGDVFEFIDASSLFFRRLWAPVFNTLEELRLRGIQVYFIEGNHDFGFEHSRTLDLRGKDHSRWVQKWSTFVGDVALEFDHVSAGKLHVRHGDDVIASDSYLRFREFVKSPFAGNILRQIPAVVSHHFFIWLAAQSRKRGESYILTEDKIVHDLGKFFDCGGFQSPDLLIIGHIHVHLDARFGEARVLAGPDWPSAPSYLFLDDDGALRRFFFNAAVPPPLMTFARPGEGHS